MWAFSKTTGFSPKFSPSSPVDIHLLLCFFRIIRNSHHHNRSLVEVMAYKNINFLLCGTLSARFGPHLLGFKKERTTSKHLNTDACVTAVLFASTCECLWGRITNERSAQRMSDKNHQFSFNYSAYRIVLERFKRTMLFVTESKIFEHGRKWPFCSRHLQMQKTKSCESWRAKPMAYKQITLLFLRLPDHYVNSMLTEALVRNFAKALCKTWG